MKRFWLLAVALLLFGSPALGGTITDADVGHVVRIGDIQIEHVWQGTVDNAPPIDWSAEMRFKQNGVAIETFGFQIDAVDPDTFAPLVIDADNAATYSLDWAGLADYLANEIDVDGDQGFWYEEATAAGALGTSTFGPSLFFLGSDIHLRDTILDRIEVSLRQWKNYTLGRVMFGFDVGVYAEITQGNPVPEPCLFALILPALFAKVRRK